MTEKVEIHCDCGLPEKRRWSVAPNVEDGGQYTDLQLYEVAIAEVYGNNMEVASQSLMDWTWFCSSYVHINNNSGQGGWAWLQWPTDIATLFVTFVGGATRFKAY